MKLTALFLFSALLIPTLRANEAAFESQLFTKGALIYSDDFDGKAFDKKRWEPRTKSWEVTDGVLFGKPDYDNAEAAKKALKRDHHLGLSPVIRLNDLPEKFVLHLRVKFEGKDFATGRPKFDIGHHINTVVFNEKGYSVKLHGGESFLGEAPDVQTFSHAGRIVQEFFRRTWMWRIQNRGGRFRCMPLAHASSLLKYPFTPRID